MTTRGTPAAVLALRMEGRSAGTNVGGSWRCSCQAIAKVRTARLTSTPTFWLQSADTGNGCVYVPDGSSDTPWLASYCTRRSEQHSGSEGELFVAMGATKLYAAGASLVPGGLIQGAG